MGGFTNLPNHQPLGSHDPYPTLDSFTPCLHACLPAGYLTQVSISSPRQPPQGEMQLYLGTPSAPGYRTTNRQCYISHTSFRRRRLSLADQPVGVPSDMGAHIAHAENNRVLQPCPVQRHSWTGRPLTGGGHPSQGQSTSQNRSSPSRGIALNGELQQAYHFPPPPLRPALRRVVPPDNSSPT